MAESDSSVFGEIARIEREADAIVDGANAEAGRARAASQEQVRELVREITPDETTQITLYEEVVDYDQLVNSLFTHDRVISWW